ncbi:MAG: Methylglyoxal synthase (EC [uncultured Caballeronia sp.]|nr:MAG: Methylglyoxal synthase (EC [uncultured Caballeronia sp.]
MERIRAGLAPDDTVDRFHAISSQTLALIAHDAMKPQMASFVDDHFELLSRFACCVSTRVPLAEISTSWHGHVVGHKAGYGPSAAGAVQWAATRKSPI